MANFVTALLALLMAFLSNAATIKLMQDDTLLLPEYIDQAYSRLASSNPALHESYHKISKDHKHVIATIAKTDPDSLQDKIAPMVESLVRQAALLEKTARLAYDRPCTPFHTLLSESIQIVAFDRIFDAKLSKAGYQHFKGSSHCRASPGVAHLSKFKILDLSLSNDLSLTCTLVETGLRVIKAKILDFEFGHDFVSCRAKHFLRVLSTVAVCLCQDDAERKSVMALHDQAQKLAQSACLQLLEQNSSVMRASIKGIADIEPTRRRLMSRTVHEALQVLPISTKDFKAQDLYKNLLQPFILDLWPTSLLDQLVSVSASTRHESIDQAVKFIQQHYHSIAYKDSHSMLEFINQGQLWLTGHAQLDRWIFDYCRRLCFGHLGQFANLHHNRFLLSRMVDESISRDLFFKLTGAEIDAYRSMTLVTEATLQRVPFNNSLHFHRMSPKSGLPFYFLKVLSSFASTLSIVDHLLIQSHLCRLNRSWLSFTHEVITGTRAHPLHCLDYDIMAAAAEEPIEISLAICQSVRYDLYSALIDLQLITSALGMTARLFSATLASVMSRMIRASIAVSRAGVWFYIPHFDSSKHSTGTCPLLSR